MRGPGIWGPKSPDPSEEMGKKGEQDKKGNKGRKQTRGRKKRNERKKKVRLGKVTITIAESRIQPPHLLRNGI